MHALCSLRAQTTQLFLSLRWRHPHPPVACLLFGSQTADRMFGGWYITSRHQMNVKML
jgi:hypothetical protein